MSTQLSVSVSLEKEYWLITAKLLDETILPKDIFVYENTETSALGNFFGTCSLKDLGRLRVYQGVQIPMFGNKYIRYEEAKIKVTLDQGRAAVDSAIASLVKNVQALSTSYQTQSASTQVYTIE